MRGKLGYPRAKKSLGQSFLKDNSVVDKIISSCALQKDDTVLEIGPGHGELTRAIIKQVKRLVCVELDPVLCGLLKDNLGENEDLRIINADILKTDLDRYLGNEKGRVKVIGNIPYYITTPILEHLFKYLDKIGEIFLTVQKEFARRIVSLPGSREYGSFSCFAQFYTDARVLFYIKKGSFFPAPKVDSAFIRLRVRTEPPVVVKDKELFFKVVRASFGQRRKMLKNSLKEAVPQAALEAYFNRYALDPKVRAENLSLQDFANLANLLNK
ncbi:MAG: 16S rRNA (adenine(1518)-N(6)/adenine(1519)-N(6))-dimethyltransferase RsmA [Candidatus Omnitrophica bacterium]|nr:16S rRNA (adenine(1518)-N(6)/adenine(1519)-N(6))-dimethyltransferase RsmA [Candidatus Omnitrophota bacterium]